VERLRAFEIAVTELESSDVSVIRAAADKSLTLVRRNSLPEALILNTVRFGPHSKGDDTRAEAELKALKAQRDPVNLLAARLPADQVMAVKGEIEQEVALAFALALADPEAGEEGGLDG
jgi:pyruvate dehydrogenase E1 component alpha subunit